MIKTWQERCEEHPDHEGIVNEGMIRARMQEEIDELRQALAQPEQEPVAWIHELADGHRHCVTNDESGYVDNFTDTYKTIPLYTAPPKRNCDNCDSLRRAAWDRINELETKLGEREWVGLTDEEVGTLTVFDGLLHVETPLLADFIRAIEAKLKEKNA